MVHIETHLDADLSLIALAKAAHMSSFHFQRVFTAIAGESPAHHVRRLRLERAAAELARGHEPVERLAIRCGYASMEPFLRAFRTHFGSTPAAYRHGRAARAVAPRRPSNLRVWVNRPGPGAQLQFVPIATGSRAGHRLPPVKVTLLPELRVAFIRRTGGAASAPADFTRLAEFACRRARPDDELAFLSLHHDDPRVCNEAVRRIDRCVVVGPRRRGDGEIGIRTIGGGDYAYASHEGAPPTLQRTVEWVESHAATHLRRVRRDGPVIEMHTDDPRTPRPRSGPPLSDLMVPVTATNIAQFWYWRRRRPGPADSTPRSKS